MSATFDAIRTEFEYQIRTAYARGLAAGKHGTRSDDADTVEAIDRAAKKVLRLIEGQPEAETPRDPALGYLSPSHRVDEAQYSDIEKSQVNFRRFLDPGRQLTAPPPDLSEEALDQHPELLRAASQSISLQPAQQS